MAKFDITKKFHEAEAFAAAAKGPILLHISDTATDTYPALRLLLEKIRPACIIHTGDSADEFKVGRKPEDRPGYEAGLQELLEILQPANCPLLFTPGNNDDFAGIEGKKNVTILPNDTVTTALGVRCQLDHYPIGEARPVDFAMFGHSGKFDFHYPPADQAGEPVYLNGMFHWTLIDTANKNFLRIPSRKPLKVTRIFITRHGQTVPGEVLENDPDLPKADPPLSVFGIAQANMLAKELKRLNFRGKILSSPFCRTMMTAQAVAQRLELPIYPCAELREIMKVKGSLSDFNGPDLDGLKKQFPEIAADATLPYPWWDPRFVETHTEVAARMEPLLDELLEQGEDVLLVAHSAGVYVLLRYLLQKNRHAYEKTIPPRYNCALSEFRYAQKMMYPVTLNSVSHIPAKLVTSNAKPALERMNTEKKWYLTQMHLHAGHENFASIRSHAVQAKRLGYDGFFITEHDLRMGWKEKDMESFRLTAPGDAHWEGEKIGWFHPDGTPARSVADGEGYALELQPGETAEFSASKRHQVSLLADFSVTLEMNIPKDTAVLVDFTLSQKPDDLTQQHLCYGLGGQEQGGWFKPLEWREDGQYTFNLSEDALYFDPAFGLDNAFLSLTVTALDGTILVRGLDTHRKYVAEGLRARQIELMKRISTAYGIKIFPGFEFSKGHHRNCFSRHVPVPNYRELGYDLDGAAYLSSYNATFAYNHMFQKFKKAPEEEHEAIIEQLIETGVETRFGGAQLLEVGFPHPKCGFGLQEHLRVWDALAMRGVRMVGYGDSDSHNSASGWLKGNNFASWILAESNSQETLEKAMRAGKVCLGNPVRWHGTWAFTIEDAAIGELLTVDEKETVTARIALSGLDRAMTLRIISGGEELCRYAIEEPAFEAEIPLSRGALDCCPVRLEIYDERNKPIFLTNPIYLVK